MSFEDFFGPQVPRPGGEAQAPTYALASAAYRDTPMEEIKKADNEWHQSEVKEGRRWAKIFRPNFGEAYSQAVIDRMLGVGRKPLVQSFGSEPQVVVEHCLAANRIRRERDTRLTAVMSVFGVLFLPGLLVWLGVFQLRATMLKADNKRVSGFGSALLAAVGVLAIVFLIRMPLAGFWGWYARGCIVLPVVGWYLAKRLCERTARDLREAWDGLLSGGSVGAKVPEAVPTSPDQAAAEQLRQSLARLSAEQQSNSVFYAGPKGILGMGTRWGSWHLAEELVPLDPVKGVHEFRAWTVVREIEKELSVLHRQHLKTGGFPTPQVKHWIVTHVGEGAKEVSRPEGTDYQVGPADVERICNNNHFGKGERHYLGVQWPHLWDGGLIITMMTTVTVLKETLRIEVTGHALGPVNGLFSGKPEAPTKTVAKTVRFWETRTVKLPLVTPDEVVRLAARAAISWYPPLLKWLGGSIGLPEPFGLRHAWADQPWKHRFMADDALRAATPVLRAVHRAAFTVLKDHDVNMDKFNARAGALSGAVQEASPKKADTYDA
ncbi:MAG: hypothetical protein JF597_26165 [Streptomyces sp.]|uniref:hypothetical protein n=1 Tax=Streptomyces sp. TaxID=1931 RepID=UPI0025D73BF7|nr:hypothetical protein [Streptomyces sp.]MBW8796955.1 hypothetical protein [Streptomyces sp.]